MQARTMDGKLGLLICWINSEVTHVWYVLCRLADSKVADVVG